MLGLHPLAAAPLGGWLDVVALAALPGASYTAILTQIDFTDPTPMTLRLCDRYLPATWTGAEWLGLIAGYGELSESQDGGPGAGEIQVTNTRPVGGRARFSDLIKTVANPTGSWMFVGAQVTIYRLGRGDTMPTTLGVLVIEEVVDVDDRTVRLRLRDASLRLEHQAPLAVITRADFPSCAHDLPGTTIPVPFGTITGAPALPIVAGTLGRLVGDIDAAVTTFTVKTTTGGDLDATDFASLRILIDQEEMTFTTRVGNVLSGCTRGASASGALPHLDGADVLEVLTNYVYAVGEHVAGYPISAISNITVEGPHSATGTVNLDDVRAGRRLATITIPRTAAEALKPVTTAPLPVTLSQYSQAFVTGNGDASFTRTAAAPAAFAYCQRVRRAVSLNITRNGTGGNTVGTVHLVVGRGRVGEAPVNVFDYFWANNVVGGVVTGGVIEYDSVADEVLTFNYSMIGTLNGGSLVVDFTSYTVQAASGGFPDRPGGPYTSAADAALGEVRCDIVGVCDDATGTLTGTAGAVLTNPADVVRYLLTLFYPAPVLPIGGASFAATRATLASRAITWALLYGHDGPLALSDLRELAARQSGGAVYLEGGAWQFRVAESPLGIEQVLDYLREVWDGRPAAATRTPSTDVYTKVTAAAGFDYATGSYRLTATATGTTPLVERTLEFPWVQDQATANLLVAYWLAVWSVSRWEVDLVAWDNLLGLRLGDQIGLDHHPILTAHGGASLALTITERGYLIGEDNPARVRLRAVEAAAWGALA
jgi:hypothetical protein